MTNLDSIHHPPVSSGQPTPPADNTGTVSRAPVNPHSYHYPPPTSPPVLQSTARSSWVCLFETALAWLVILLIVFFVISFPAQAQFSSTASYIRPVSSLPATCNANAGAVVYLTTTKVLYNCTATNTWAAVGSGGGGSAGTVFKMEAACQAGAAASGVSHPTTANSYPTSACLSATNIQSGVITFSGLYSQSMQVKFIASATGDLTVRGTGYTSATSGNWILSFATALTTTGGTTDPTFGAATNMTIAANGTTLRLAKSSITLPLPAGVAVGDEVWVKVSWVPGSNTMGAVDASVISISGVQ